MALLSLLYCTPLALYSAVISTWVDICYVVRSKGVLRSFSATRGIPKRSMEHRLPFRKSPISAVMFESFSIPVQYCTLAVLSIPFHSIPIPPDPWLGTWVHKVHHHQQQKQRHSCRNRAFHRRRRFFLRLLFFVQSVLWP